MKRLFRLFLMFAICSCMVRGESQDGLNIWQVALCACDDSEVTHSKTGEIESKLDTLDLDVGDSLDSVTDLLCSKLELLSTCQMVTQDDVSTTGFNITSSGHYCLAENVTHTNASAAAITISANNVTLDLNGHIIDCTSTGDVGIEVSSGVNNVVVKNGRVISAVSDGVVVDNATRVCVIDIKSSQHGVNGFSIENDSSHILVDRCVAQANTADGVVLSDSSYCIFRDCIADNNTVNGFVVDVPAGGFIINANMFIRCQANGNGSLGFVGTASAGGRVDNTIVCNCIAINNASGFDFDDVSAVDSVLLECKSISNTSGYTGNGTTSAFANLALSNTTNYSGITTPIETTPATTTAYWTNLDQ